MASRTMLCKELDSILLNALPELNKIQAEFVVGVSRGGLLPSTKLSHLLGIPHVTAAIDKETSVVYLAPKIKRSSRVIIVDTVVRTGGTLEKVVKCFDRPLSLTILSSPENRHLSNMCLLSTDEWIEPEWEGEWLRKNLGWEHQFKCDIGFDLDGIICPDIAIPSILSPYDLIWHIIRGIQKPLYIPPKNSIIVTGRPIRDSKSTILWLRKNGIYNFVEFNNGSPTSKDAIKTKVGAIISKNLKVFYESDAAQTVEIQKLVGSNIEVRHWRK